PGDSGLAGSLTSFPSTIELRERLLYFAALENGDAENWFGAAITSSPVDQTFNVTNLATGSVPGDPTAVELALQGVTAPVVHNVSVTVNGMSVGTIDFVGITHQVARLSIPPELLQEGANVVTLQSMNGDMDVSLVDYARLTYNHTYRADSNAVSCTSP